TTSSSSATSSTSTPSVRIATTVDCVSPLRPNPDTCVSPSQSAPISTARCEIDLSPGTAMWPTSAPAGSIFIRPARARRPRGTPAPRARPRRARPLAPAADEQRQRPAPLARHVLQLEVLDVDPLGAERLRDPGEHAWAVRYVHPQPLQRARLLVRLGEHPAAVARCLRDP